MPDMTTNDWNLRARQLAGRIFGHDWSRPLDPLGVDLMLRAALGVYDGLAFEGLIPAIDECLRRSGIERSESEAVIILYNTTAWMVPVEDPAPAEPE